MTPEILHALKTLRTYANLAKSDYVAQAASAVLDDHAALSTRVTQLEAELAAAKEDSERLTRIIDESLNGKGWLDDGVWDRASDFYEDDENPQLAVRAAIDEARGPQ
jgi:hypothetical protein